MAKMIGKQWLLTIEQLNQCIALIFAVLFWAYFVEQWLLSFLIGCAFVFSYLRRGQWQSHLQHFHAIGDFCGIALITLVLYFFFTAKSVEVIYLVVQMFPVILFPLVVAQQLSAQQQIPLSAILYRLRSSKESIKWFDVQFIYLCVCLISAGTAMSQHRLYYPFLIVLLAGFLLNHRRTDSSWKVWLMMWVAAIGMGYLGQVTLYQLHDTLGKQVGAWMAQWFHQHQTFSREGVTAIGQVGKLKLSDNIVLRVKASQSIGTPLLLRTASFDRYQKNTWFATQANPQSLQDHDGQWTIRAQMNGSVNLDVFQYIQQTAASLSLPLGTGKITGLYVNEVQKNRFQSVVIKNETGLIHFIIHYDPAQRDFGLPQENDWWIPNEEQQAIATVSENLQLKGQSPQHVLATISTFFQTKFQYSTWLSQPSQTITPLSGFLLHSRRGHCEYFATATVLLLRQAGIAARYVTGFSAQEIAGDMILVRGRDAHAWAMAYIQGEWVNVDTTPSNWFEVENKDRDMWQGLRDGWHALRFMYDHWQLQGDENSSRWLWVLLVILAIPAWRMMKSMDLFHVSDTSIKTNDQVNDASPFERIKIILDVQCPRQSGETLRIWVDRIDHPELKEILVWHERWRFCEQGLTPNEKNNFEKMVKNWLCIHEKA